MLKRALERRDVRISLRLLPTALVIVACVVLLRKLDPGLLARALASARWPLLVAAAALNLVLNTAARTRRFAVLLGPLPRAKTPSTLALASLLLATRTLNAVLPAKTGETLRAFKLHQRYGYEVSSVLAALVVEPLVEALSLALPALVVLAVMPPAGFLARPLHVIAAAGVGVLAVVALAAWHRSRAGVSRAPARARGLLGRAVAFYQRTARALLVIHSPRVLSRALLWSWVSDAVDLMTIALCLEAVGARLPLLQCFLLLIAVNVAIAIPATPGSVGLLEAGAVIALGAMGVAQGPALAFAIFYHAVHVIPIAIPGALALQFSWVRPAGPRGGRRRPAINASSQP